MSEHDVVPFVDVSIQKVKEARLQCELLRDEPFELSVDAATNILELQTFAGERLVDDRHVQELYDEMILGRFRPEQVRLAVCYVGDDLYRINGQHTCWARINMPPAYKCHIRKLTYRVPNLQELKKLYAVFDPSYSARSVGHLTRILLLDTPATENISVQVISNLAVGFKFWRWGSTPEFRRQGHNEVSNEIQKYANLFQAVATFYQPFYKASHIGKRSAVIAAMFECFDKKPSIAESFWKPVCDGLNLTDPQDARYILMKWLQGASLDAAHYDQKKGKKVVSTEDMYRVCINVWNRWRKDEKISGGLRTTNKRFQAQ